jgi:hypothetical protein
MVSRIEAGRETCGDGGTPEWRATAEISMRRAIHGLLIKYRLARFS